MRIWLVSVLIFTMFVASFVAACKPISPEGSSLIAEPARVTTPGAVSEQASTPTEEAMPRAAESTATATEALAETSAVVQSTAEAESVAPTDAPATPEAVATQAQPSEELLAFGYATYRKQYCGICHELEAAGTTGTFGPPHNHVGSMAAERILQPNYSGHATTAAEYLHESLVMPEIYIVDGFALSSHRMPNYSFLSDAELDALVAFLLAQK